MLVSKKYNYEKVRSVPSQKYVPMSLLGLGPQEAAVLTELTSQETDRK